MKQQQQLRRRTTIRHRYQRRRRFSFITTTKSFIIFSAIFFFVVVLTGGGNISFCCLKKWSQLQPHPQVLVVHAFVNIINTSSSSIIPSSQQRRRWSRSTALLLHSKNKKTYYYSSWALRRPSQAEATRSDVSKSNKPIVTPFHQLAASCRVDNNNNNNQMDETTTIQHHHDSSSRPSSSSSSSSSWKNTFAKAGLITTLLFTVLSQPDVANAGFGPSGGATTSPTAGLSTPKIQVQDLDKKKVGQLIDSTIDESRLDEFQSQLDTLIDSINNYINDLQQQADDDQQQQQDDNKNKGQQKTTTTTRLAQQPQEESEEEDDEVGSYEEISQRLESVTVEEEIQRLENAKSLRELVTKRDQLLDSLESQPLWFNYLAAFCGSVASTLVMHPIDTIKTRLQVPNSTSTTTTTTTSTTTSIAATKNSTTTIISNNTENEATITTSHQQQYGTTTTGQFENLYEGLTGNIIKEGPPSALYLGVYETVKSSLLHGPYAGAFASFLGMASSTTAQAASSSSSSSAITTTTNPMYLLWIYLLAGAAGETVGSVVRAPAEALKSTVQTGTASSFTEAFTKVILDEDGRCNVLRAWSASLWRDVPFGAIQLAIFELIKAAILNNPNIDFDSSTLQSEAIIGAFAGGCGAFLTNPTDVITTRIITQSVDGDDESSSGDGGGGNGPLGVLGMGRLIYEEGGLGAFFAGWQARVLYWAPAISLFLTCYCSVRQLGVRLEWFGQ